MKDSDFEKYQKMSNLFKTTDHDSFAALTGGLKNNWVLLMAIFAIGGWVVTNLNDTKNVNVLQDSRIESNEKAVEAIGISVTTLTNEMRNNVNINNSTNNEILRRLDLVQKDIEIIKEK